MQQNVTGVIRRGGVCANTKNAECTDEEIQINLLGSMDLDIIVS